MYKPNKVKAIYHKTSKRKWLYPIIYVVGLIVLRFLLKWLNIDNLIDNILIYSTYFYLITRK
jgi:hypothetical protein